MLKISSLILLIYSQSLLAVNLEKVLSSSVKHYPEIQKAKVEYKINRRKFTKNQGAFDSKLIGNSQQRVDGYYDGDYSSLKLVKPLPYFNSKLEGGYRRSEGEIPVYEKEHETLSDGEYFLGINFSLLRDSLIDNNRLEVKNQQLQNDISKTELLSKKLKTLKSAELAYYEYIINYIITDVYSDLYKLSKDQQTAIEKRARKGDLARIYITENLQYLTKRKNKLLKATQDLDLARIYLSLFFRDDLGKTKLVKDKDHKLEFKEIEVKSEQFEQEIERALSRNPQFRIFDLALKQYENEIEFKDNQTLPKLNLKLSSAKDQGEGLESYRGEEQKIMLDLEIPIERRKIDSDLAISKLKQDKIKIEQRFYQDKFKNYLSQLQIKLLNLTKQIETSQLEIKYAQKLEKAERIKFFNGDSDLILLNLREQKTVDAKLELLDYKLKYIKAAAAYKEAVVHEDYLKYIQD